MLVESAHFGPTTASSVQVRYIALDVPAASVDTGGMRVVGVDIAATTIQWIGIDGLPAAGSLFAVGKNKLDLPTLHPTEPENYRELKNLIFENLRAVRAERVGVVRADKGIGLSPARAKCELIVQLAALELNVECRLVAAQTIRAAQQRRIAEATGSNFQTAFNGGVSIAPGYLERAALCAWTVLQ